ncbi:hypothetical protein HPP92_018706 [Vanilla planifolia]|uniref:Uncharacterized protein n=1 Tax=Vanilla planifolia TaxID=51239 RepID=A0A835QDG4_VANPL|nr:hypothetical protein HPP92_018706 [Vanilla planifolia]
MAVELIGTTIIKPTPSTSTEPKHVPLTIFDRAAFNLHVPVLYAFLPPNPSNDSLKLGLSRILSYFPHLAGRITTDNHLGCPCIHLNDAGVRFNRYSCGGLVIGATSHHRVADGQSMSNFFTSWANMVRRGTGPQPPPFLDRAAIVVPRNIESSSTTGRSNSGRQSIHFMKPPTRPPHALVPERRCSTFEVLLSPLAGHLEGKGLPESQVTKVRVAVNGRARMRPVVPAEFFGNLVLWAHPTATVRELAAEGGGLANAVRIINEAVERVDDRYFGRSSTSGRWNVATWGDGASDWERAVPESRGGQLAEEKDGVDVFIALAAEHVGLFIENCYSLD